MEKPKIFDLSLQIDVIKEQMKYVKKGQKHIYLDARMIELKDKQFNDYMIVVKVPKDEYEAGVKGAIIGNAKDWSLRDNNSQGGQSANKIDADDLPW
jgi:hypothetical protein